MFQPNVVFLRTRQLIDVSVSAEGCWSCMLDSFIAWWPVHISWRS